MNTAEYSGNDPIIIQQVNNSGVRTGSVRDAVESYGDTLFRLCLIMLRNHADAEDAVQETFIKYMPLLTIEVTDINYGFGFIVIEIF